MKKAILFAALAAIFAGCQTAHIETPEWKASINSHWFKRDVDKLAVTRQADGSYSLSLNGYKSDASEQLPAFTREMWQGLAFVGQLVAASASPVRAPSIAVPVAAEPAKSAGGAADPLPAATASMSAGGAADPLCADGSCSE